MEIKETIIKARSGKYDYLDRSYQKFMSDMDLERVEIYNLIIPILLQRITQDEFRLFKYKVTGDDCINDILLVYIDLYESDLFLQSLRQFIVDFITLDWISFYTL